MAAAAASAAAAVAAAPGLSFPAVLQFLQTEHRRFERERNEWELERSDLRAKLQFLECERRSMETAKTDLLRRVKMLEFALRQERGKCMQLHQGSSADPAAAVPLAQVPGDAAKVPGSVLEVGSVSSNLDPSANPDALAATAATSGAGPTLGYTKGVNGLRTKEILKNYLREANFLLAHSGLALPSPTGSQGPRSLASKLEEGSHLQQAEDSFDEPHSFIPTSQTKLAAASAKQFPDQIRSAPPKQIVPSDSDTPQTVPADDADELDSSVVPDDIDEVRVKGDFHGDNSSNNGDHDSIDDGDSTTWSEDEYDLDGKISSSGEPQLWKPRTSLRSHLDSVRCVEFLPKELALISGSEDGTSKLWNLKHVLTRRTGIELEPSFTFRGHKGPVTSLTVSKMSPTLFTGSLDATIISWNIPPASSDSYAEYNTGARLSTFIGHSDAIWDLKLHPLPQQYPILASASADGTVKLWDVSDRQHALKSTLRRTPDSSDSRDSPTSIDWPVNEMNRIAVGYQSCVIRLFDVESGDEVMKLEDQSAVKVGSQINKIVCHPTMPLLAAAYEDRHIRFFDLQSGQCTHSMLGHLDSVSSVDFSPNGLTLVSGGHDCSIRWWDVGSRMCVQEYSSHRKKYDEGIWSVRYHPQRPHYIATGGSDSLVKILTSTS